MIFHRWRSSLSKVADPKLVAVWIVFPNLPLHLQNPLLLKSLVGKKLSELIGDTGGQSSGSEQDRWQHELVEVAIELIVIVTNSGWANTLVTSDAAAPTLKRIERSAIAAETPIAYHSRRKLHLPPCHLYLGHNLHSIKQACKKSHACLVNGLLAGLLFFIAVFWGFFQLS